MTLSKTAPCAITGDIKPIKDMIRFVISPDHKVVADISGKLPGQFLWVTASRQAIKKAVWRNVFAGTAKTTVEIPENLLETIEERLSAQALQTLSLAKKAGELTTGFTKTDEALRSDNTSVYVVARDSSENGREKLERLAGHRNIDIVDIWSCAELSHTLGSENVNHLCLSRGGLAHNFSELVAKLKAIKTE